MVTRVGMSEHFGMMGLATVESQYLEGRAALTCGESTASEIDGEVRAIINSCYEKAFSLLKDNRKILDEISDFLYKNETITGKEFMDMFRRLSQENQSDNGDGNNGNGNNGNANDSYVGNGDVNSDSNVRNVRSGNVNVNGANVSDEIASNVVNVNTENGDKRSLNESNVSNENGGNDKDIDDDDDAFMIDLFGDDDDDDSDDEGHLGRHIDFIARDGL